MAAKFEMQRNNFTRLRSVHLSRLAVYKIYSKPLVVFWCCWKKEEKKQGGSFCIIDLVHYFCSIQRTGRTGLLTERAFQTKRGG